MPVTVAVNQLTVVHQESGGMVTFMPDVCLTPAPPGSPVPIPYANLALSRDTANGSKDVTCDGHPIMLQGSCFRKSSGDEAGSVGGIVSGVTRGAAEFILYSFDVFVDGRPVARATDLMLGNKGGTFNTPPAPEMQPPLPGVADAPDPDVERQIDKLKVVLKDGAGNPIKNEHVILVGPDGQKLDGKTDASGAVEIAETVGGIGKVGFPDLSEAIIYEEK